MIDDWSLPGYQVRREVHQIRRQTQAYPPDLFDLIMSRDRTADHEQHCRNRLDFKAQTPSSVMLAAILCIVAKVTEAEGQQSCACTKPEANSLLTQHIVLVPQEKPY